MKIITRVIESMLSKDAAQQWTGKTSAVSSHEGWGWSGAANSGWGWSGFSE